MTLALTEQVFVFRNQPTNQPTNQLSCGTQPSWQLPLTPKLEEVRHFYQEFVSAVFFYLIYYNVVDIDGQSHA